MPSLMTMTRKYFDLHSLHTQMILSFTLLAILSATAAGLPAVWLNHEQLNNRAWVQINQGIRAARAIYSAKQKEVISLATLTAQRPTLQRLLVDNDQDALTPYLLDLMRGAGFDLVIICDLDDLIVASSDQTSLVEVCQMKEDVNYLEATEGGETEVWLLASNLISGEKGNFGKVIIGIILDDDFVLEMHDQTGLEHSVYLDDQLIATSLDIDLEKLSGISHKLMGYVTFDSSIRTSFIVKRNSYYATRIRLSEPGLEAEVALNIVDIIATQRRLAIILIGSIIAASALASILGALLARRISYPLVQLADSATMLSKDNLDISVAVASQVREVTSVAQALESARIDLKSTLTSLQKERDWGDHLLESIVEGIVTLDEHHRILYFSSGAEQITGWSRDQVIQRSIDDVFKLVDSDNVFSSQIPLPGEKHKITARLKNRRYATLAVTGAKFIPSEAGESQVALVFRDVSEEDAINRLLGRFISNVAHEFRTPLSALAASIELLMDQLPDLNSAEVQELLENLHLGILGLETLIDNLLESANIEAKRLRVSPRPSDLGDIIAETIQTMDPLLKKYGQRLALDLPTKIPLVQADSWRTIQVLINLIYNASKYGPSDAEISIEVKTEPGWVRVEVADRGPGIPLEYKEDLFIRFIHPAVENEKAKAGVGLGLSVVKAIVDAQGGSVGVEDRSGGGAIFWFTLPTVNKL